MLDRIPSNRRLCGKCGVDYNLMFHRPAVADICDLCGGPLIARADDNPEAVRTRLHDYHTKTTPILELFRRKELVVARWMAPARPEVVHTELLGRLTQARPGA